MTSLTLTGVGGKWSKAVAGGIAFRAASAVETSFASTLSPVINAPAGLQDGDCIVIGISCDQGINQGSASLNGFTVVHHLSYSTTGTNFTLVKIASGEGATWTFTNLFAGTTAGCAAAVAYTGVHQTVPTSGTATEVDVSSATTTPSSTAMAPAVDNCMLIGVFASDPAGTPTGTAGTGCTERADFVRSGEGHIFIEEKLQTTATSESMSMTSTASTFFGVVQLALNPA